MAYQVPVISAGSATATNGSLLNIGQGAIGVSNSKTHMMFAGGIPAILYLSARPLRGDLDGDGYVDNKDYAILADCMNGPDEPTPPRGCTQQQFELADIHTDNDVDIIDFAMFENQFGAALPR